MTLGELVEKLDRIKEIEWLLSGHPNVRHIFDEERRDLLNELEELYELKLDV